MNNGANQIQGKHWQIDLQLSASQKSVGLGDQKAIDGKKVITILACQNANDEDGNALTKDNFVLDLERKERNKMQITSDAFMNPANPTVFVLNECGIVWNKSKISFPTTGARFVKLIVIYED